MDYVNICVGLTNNTLRRYEEIWGLEESLTQLLWLVSHYNNWERIVQLIFALVVETLFWKSRITVFTPFYFIQFRLIFIKFIKNA